MEGMGFRSSVNRGCGKGSCGHGWSRRPGRWMTVNDAGRGLAQNGCIGKLGMAALDRMWVCDLRHNALTCKQPNVSAERPWE